jgi:hypothetical protein
MQKRLGGIVSDMPHPPPVPVTRASLPRASYGILRHVCVCTGQVPTTDYTDMEDAMFKQWDYETWEESDDELGFEDGPVPCGYTDMEDALFKQWQDETGEESDDDFGFKDGPCGCGCGDV